MTETKQIATLLHTLLCNKKHAVEMFELDDENKCCFYVEDSIDESWRCKDHLTWLEEARRFIAIAEPHGVKDVVSHMVKVYQTLHGFKSADPRLGEYLIRLIKNTM